MLSGIQSTLKVMHSALKSARNAVRRNGGMSRIVNIPRVLPMPQNVGAKALSLLIPLFALLSVIGAVAGAAADIAKAVNDAKANE